MPHSLFHVQESDTPTRELKEAKDAERLRKTIETERLAVLRREVADLEHVVWRKGAGAGADQAKIITMRDVHSNDAFGNYGKLDPYREQLSLVDRRLAAQRKYDTGFRVKAALTRGVDCRVLELHARSTLNLDNIRGEVRVEEQEGGFARIADLLFN